jgi:hypothetical protein
VCVCVCTCFEIVPAFARMFVRAISMNVHMHTDVHLYDKGMCVSCVLVRKYSAFKHIHMRKNAYIFPGLSHQMHAYPSPCGSEWNFRVAVMVRYGEMVTMLHTHPKMLP